MSSFTFDIMVRNYSFFLFNLFLELKKSTRKRILFYFYFFFIEEDRVLVIKLLRYKIVGG